MSLTNPNTPVSQQDLYDFYHKILPYLGGSSSGGGHTIIDGNNTEMAQEDNLKFSNDFEVTDNDTDGNTEVEQHEISSAEWNEIMAVIPSPGAVTTPAGFTPVGTVIAVMGTTAPQNYLACDGTTYSIERYKVLADYIKDQFGSYDYFGGDGTTTFAVPDLRGEFLRGTGTNSHTNQGDGANVGVHQDGTVYNGAVSNDAFIIVSGKSSELNHDTDISNIPRRYIGGGTADNLGDGFTARPTNTSVLYCIAAYNIYIDARFDYSTEEKIVGTWIDGKPLYQKTFSVTSPATAVTMLTVQALDGTYEIKKIDGYLDDSGNMVPINWQYDENMYIRTWENSNNIVMKVSSSFLNKPVGITIQYTKSTT